MAAEILPFLTGRGEPVKRGETRLFRVSERLEMPGGEAFVLWHLMLQTFDLRPNSMDYPDILELHDQALRGHR